MTRFYSLLPLAALLALFELGSQARPINDDLLDSYDYIIVGGGASGLTVANRLTEDPSVTVLVLEAGPVDEDEEWMRVPFFVGNNPTPPAGSLSGHLQYDWNLGTEAQTYLDGKTRHYPLGRGVGGGTLINGMLWNRGNIGDYDDWATLIGDDGWSWQSMLQYFKRSETFTADYSAQSAGQYQIHSDPAVHGAAVGGVNVSYQGHYYTGTEHFYNGLNELGVPTEGDPNAGATAGASFLPMSIDPVTKTRADARRAHYDPHASRDNLYISSGQFVTRLIWDDNAPCNGNGTGTNQPSGSSNGTIPGVVPGNGTVPGTIPENGTGGSTPVGGSNQTNPADPTNPFSPVSSSVDGSSEGGSGSGSGSGFSNGTVPSWSNGTSSPGSSVSGSVKDGRGRHWGLKLDDVADGLSNGLGVFNLFPVGQLFDLLKSSAPANWDPNSGVEVHEVTTTSFECNCQENSCSSSKKKRSTKKNKRQQTQCKLRVGGVEYAADASAERRVITAKREVILAAGAVHTPLILQHSGVGDSDLLDSYDIETRLDLPGVGNNYQDHYMLASNNHFAANDDTPVAYATNTDTNRNLFWDEHTGPWTAGPPNGVAFPSLKDMTDNFTSVLNWAESQGSGEHLLAGLDDTLVAGYERQKALLIDALNDRTRGQFEILNNNGGSFTYSLMKPLSRGQIRIRSSDPFDTPVIDPRYGSNPIDLAYMMEAMRFNHRLVKSAALAALEPEENYPTAEQVADDARLLTLIKGGLFTEYHPTGTASMLPLEDGGVVDARLTVYGTQNLRIVDSSVMPLIPAAHLQACVYGVAEKAADLIRE
ncbi:Glucose-methanol-choline oxidoreductase [Botryosphaeria dothidea]|uniref:Glucose-methanol-choline oxidoreductase n=1 Tax=Botryosphaeria dothidea TaxID=55169 RepID=A0A8H4J1D2_9PEZI|nr:Glucose-methanol-choline oxidoreductase [Botryosphaeria dothidea]